MYRRPVLWARFAKKNISGNKIVTSHVPPHNRHTLFKQIVVDLSQVFRLLNLLKHLTFPREQMTLLLTLVTLLVVVSWPSGEAINHQKTFQNNMPCFFVNLPVVKILSLCQTDTNISEWKCCTAYVVHMLRSYPLQSAWNPANLGQSRQRRRNQRITNFQLAGCQKFIRENISQFLYF